MTQNKIIQNDLYHILHSDVDWSMFENSTVLVTGANGFLPAYMVETLLTLNDFYPNLNVRVLGLVRNIDNAWRRFRSYKETSNLVFVEQDVSSPLKIEEKIDYIIHAASQASPK